MHRDAGFTLIEMVCVLAITSLLAGLALQAIPRGTSRAALEAYALEAASLLKADRTAAIRERREVSTKMNSTTRLILSGYSARTVQLPNDITLDALLAQRCDNRATGITIDFFPSGMSCGGTIGLSRPGLIYQIRVNWLTGGIEVVSLDKP